MPAVNRKRHYAALLLQQAAGAASHRHLEQALLQGAVTHLWQAVLFYLAEIASAYQCPDAASAASPVALAEMLEAMDKTPGEVSEILALDRDSRSWLGQLRACRESLASAQQVLPRQERDDLIAVVPVTGEDDWSLIHREQVENWAAALGAMLERQREVMVEC